MADISGFLAAMKAKEPTTPGGQMLAQMAAKQAGPQKPPARPLPKSRHRGRHKHASAAQRMMALRNRK